MNGISIIIADRFSHITQSKNDISNDPYSDQFYPIGILRAPKKKNYSSSNNITAIAPNHYHPLSPLRATCLRMVLSKVILQSHLEPRGSGNPWMILKMYRYS